MMVRRLLWTLCLVACSHAEPFPDGANPAAETPRSGTPPVQFTFSPVPDLSPNWSPDGSALLYSFVRRDSAQVPNRCIGLLPANGGSRLGERCSSTRLSTDSLTALMEPAMSPDGQIAWVQTGTLRVRVPSDHTELMLGTLERNSPARVLVTFPYVTTSGQTHMTATSLRWLTSTRLAYIGTDLLYTAACKICKLDTLTVGREIAIIDLTANPAPLVVAGTTGATSLWPDPTGTWLYFTVAGDTRVWLVNLAGGAPAMVHDFAAAGIARDVSVAASRLAAVVGGRVRYADDPPLGPRQYDDGGRIALVDLTTGDESSVFFLGDTVGRHAVITPDGRRLVAEKFDSLNSDLFTVSLP